MSNPRVTITLGRTGQVVERGGRESNFSHGYNGIISGSKRSTRDGQGVDSNVWPADKRRRGDGINGSSAGNIQQDYQLSRHDLRLKLIRKRQPKQSQAGRDIHQPTPPSHRIPQYNTEANGSAGFRKMPSRESADDLYSSLRNPYSSRAANGMRGRSPDRTLGISPPRHFDEMWKIPQVRSTDASRAERFTSSGVISAPRKMGAAVPIPMMGSSGAGKLVSHFPQGRGSMQQMVDEPRTVSGLLHALGLEKYAILFQAEEVDMTVLRQMGDKDLKDLGLPMGPRKKILLALFASRPQRQSQ